MTVASVVLVLFVSVVFLDGFSAMPLLSWPIFKRKVLAKPAGLVVTSHHPTTLPTLHQCATTPDLFIRIVHDLLGPNRTIPEPELIQIYHVHNANIRTALRELYDTA